MGVLAFQTATDWTVITCCRAGCETQFAVPDAVKETWRRNGTTFYCPHGHTQWYGKSTEDRLRDRLADAERVAEQERQSAKAARAREQMALHSLRAQKGAKTRLKNRIKHGVCPCCTRTFQDLARHMQTKHPDYNGANDNN